MSEQAKKPHLLTAEGLERLKEELQQLITEGRAEVAERLHEAFADGQDDDFVDNAGLEAARNEQAFLEGRIMELEDIINNHKIIDSHTGPHKSVRVGDMVTVIEVGEDIEETYHLVGAAEADPSAGRISNESPLGRALLGAAKGAIVTVNAPNGVIEFEVVNFE